MEDVLQLKRQLLKASDSPVSVFWKTTFDLCSRGDLGVG